MAATIQITNNPFLYANGLELSNNSTTPNTKLNVALGVARDSTNTNDMQLTAGVIIDATVNGLNGLDTGSLAANTWYAVYLIGSSVNSFPTGAMLSTSLTAPTMPYNYDMWRRIGWVLTDGSSHFLLYYVRGSGNVRQYYWDAVITELNAGAATSFTDVDLKSSMPSTSQIAYLESKIVPATAGNLANLRVNGSASTTNLQITGSVAAQPNVGQWTIPTDSAQIIEYKVANASDALTLYSLGFQDAL